MPEPLSAEEVDTALGERFASAARLLGDVVQTALSKSLQYDRCLAALRAGGDAAHAAAAQANEQLVQRAKHAEEALLRAASEQAQLTAKLARAQDSSAQVAQSRDDLRAQLDRVQGERSIGHPSPLGLVMAATYFCFPIPGLLSTRRRAGEATQGAAPRENT